MYILIVKISWLTALQKKEHPVKSYMMLLMVKQGYLCSIISYVNVYVKEKKVKIDNNIEQFETAAKKGENVNDTIFGFYVFS